MVERTRLLTGLLAFWFQLCELGQAHLLYFLASDFSSVEGGFVLDDF